MNAATDPVDRYAELENRIRMMVVPSEQVISRRAVIASIAATFLMLSLILAGIVWITVDTNREISTRVSLRERNDELEVIVADLEAEIDALEAADSQAVVSLQERNDDLEATVEAQEIVVAQAVAAITAMCDQIQAAGGACPRVELNPALGPPTPPTPEG